MAEKNTNNKPQNGIRLSSYRPLVKAEHLRPLSIFARNLGLAHALQRQYSLLAAPSPKLSLLQPFPDGPIIRYRDASRVSSTGSSWVQPEMIWVNTFKGSPAQTPSYTEPIQQVLRRPSVTRVSAQQPAAEIQPKTSKPRILTRPAGKAITPAPAVQPVAETEQPAPQTLPPGYVDRESDLWKRMFPPRPSFLDGVRSRDQARQTSQAKRIPPPSIPSQLPRTRTWEVKPGHHVPAGISAKTEDSDSRISRDTEIPSESRIPSQSSVQYPEDEEESLIGAAAPTISKLDDGTQERDTLAYQAAVQTHSSEEKPVGKLEDGQPVSKSIEVGQTPLVAGEPIRPGRPETSIETKLPRTPRPTGVRLTPETSSKPDQTPPEEPAPNTKADRSEAKQPLVSGKQVQRMTAEQAAPDTKARTTIEPKVDLDEEQKTQIPKVKALPVSLQKQPKAELPLTLKPEGPARQAKADETIPAEPAFQAETGAGRYTRLEKPGTTEAAAPPEKASIPAQPETGAKVVAPSPVDMPEKEPAKEPVITHPVSSRPAVQPDSVPAVDVLTPPVKPAESPESKKPIVSREKAAGLAPEPPVHKEPSAGEKTPPGKIDRRISESPKAAEIKQRVQAAPVPGSARAEIRTIQKEAVPRITAAPVQYEMDKEPSIPWQEETGSDSQAVSLPSTSGEFITPPKVFPQPETHPKIQPDRLTPETTELPVALKPAVDKQLKAGQEKAPEAGIEPPQTLSGKTGPQQTAPRVRVSPTRQEPVSNRPLPTVARSEEPASVGKSPAGTPAQPSAVESGLPSSQQAEITTPARVSRQITSREAEIDRPVQPIDREDRVARAEEMIQKETAHSQDIGQEPGHAVQTTPGVQSKFETKPDLKGQDTKKATVQPSAIPKITIQTKKQPPAGKPRVQASQVAPVKQTPLNLERTSSRVSSPGIPVDFKPVPTPPGEMRAPSIQLSAAIERYAKQTTDEIEKPLSAGMRPVDRAPDSFEEAQNLQVRVTPPARTDLPQKVQPASAGKPVQVVHPEPARSKVGKSAIITSRPDATRISHPVSRVEVEPPAQTKLIKSGTIRIDPPSPVQKSPETPLPLISPPILSHQGMSPMIHRDIPSSGLVTTGKSEPDKVRLPVQRKAPEVQPMPLFSTVTIYRNVEESQSSESSSSESQPDDSSSQGEKPDVDKIAEQVYDAIKQRLVVERERYWGG